jgi:7-carboxy-7-deazaguanine synthase
MDQIKADIQPRSPTAKRRQQESNRLRVTEIFYSLQGESRTVGCPTVFIRLTGCPLRCGYCDTAYAFHGGEWKDIAAILNEAASYQTRYVTVTGGEPLAQKACIELLTQLCDAGFEVSLETSGALDVSAVDSRVIKVMDLKTPGSGEVDKNLYSNIQYLTKQDQVKFVICDRADYEWAKDILKTYRLVELCEVLFSPSHGQLLASDLADWILADRLAVRFQIQMHKILWGDVPGR